MKSLTTRVNIIVINILSKNGIRGVNIVACEFIVETHANFTMNRKAIRDLARLICIVVWFKFKVPYLDSFDPIRA